MIATVIAVSIAAPLAQAQAPAEDTAPTTTYDDLSMLGTIYSYIQATNPFREFAGAELPSPQWLLAKAACETGPNPQDRGRYAGMFGIMHRGTETDSSGLPSNSSWGRWGGFHFAPSPDKATPLDQIRIFLRINYTGWHRPNGLFRPPSYAPKDNQCYQYADKVLGGRDLSPVDPYSFLNELRAELTRYGLSTD